jgi:F-type H+-transporting ATPase subunit delta
MAETLTVARPYAEAAFALADRQGTLGKWSPLLERLAAIAGDPVAREAVRNPELGAERVYAMFAALCGELLFDEAQRFLRVLIDNGRLDALVEIRELFEALRREREGVAEANIVSAFPLEGAQLAALVAALEARLQRKVRTVVGVDRELIGGVRIQIGDEVIDGSVRGKLGAMAAALRA